MKDFKQNFNLQVTVAIQEFSLLREVYGKR